ncbi:NADH-quinone oxidoreductase subunit M [Schaalia sp. 19OD2882]|uniref:complex I subunit 4 family protein n=1 Tax=Schaalia sp. 19OD2882 TaxID=2794089 RepID=UPI001C1EAD7B|nr:NADH-quinone oxidoreductase subunit M [Schaalia sp. 19OD2882]QWW20583.1 NADH-quinone oxidoreductase subunit M [Schaalia sp. 19OD2882]
MVNAQLPLLSVLVALPTVGALLLAAVPALRKMGRAVALVVSLLELIVALWVFVGQFDWAAAGSHQLVESWVWIPEMGVSWSLGVNALGAVMVLLAIALVPIVLVAGWDEDADPARDGTYAALVLVLETFMVLIFSAFDVVVFYIAFEAMLIPLYLMIGRFGVGDEATRKAAAMKFLLFSLAGGLVMLGGLVALWAQVPAALHTDSFFRLDTLVTLTADLAPAVQMGVFISFMVAFAIKAPMVPVHTWLPDTAAVARPGTSVLLVGVLDKIGTFGMLALCLSLFPGAAVQAAPVLCVLAVVSVIWGGLAAIGQDDIMRLVSYTSVSHFGFMVLGTFIGTLPAMVGAMFYMVAHGVSIAAMFLLSGWLAQRAGTGDMRRFSGMQRVTPVLAGLWLVSGLASVALPGLSGFVPEYMVLMGTWQKSIPLALFAVTGVVIAAIYLLLPYQRVFTGGPRKETGSLPDLGAREKSVMVPLVAAMFILGIVSAPVISALTPVAEDLLSPMSAVADQAPATSSAVLTEGISK